MDSTEKNYIQNLVAGDKAAFIWIHQKYQSKVYYYALKLIKQSTAAEEITSDVFVKIWEKKDQLQTNSPLDGLLFKITRDFCISYLRKVARNHALRKQFIENYKTQIAKNPTEEHLLLKEGWQLATDLIEKLPAKRRLVFQLRYFYDLSLKEIAEELNISINTVQNHLTKGTKFVKTQISANSDFVFLFFLLCYL